MTVFAFVGSRLVLRVDGSGLRLPTLDELVEAVGTHVVAQGRVPGTVRGPDGPLRAIGLPDDVEVPDDFRLDGLRVAYGSLRLGDFRAAGAARQWVEWQRAGGGRCCRSTRAAEGWGGLPPRTHPPMPRSSRSRTLLVCLGAIAASPVTTHGQAPGALPLSQQLSNATRAMALGDAYAMESGHADALFYHPALLVDAGGIGLEIQRWGPAASAAAASAAFSWLGGGVGIGLRTLQYGAAAGASCTAVGCPPPPGGPAPGGQDHLFVLGETPVSERIATFGYARDFLSGTTLGAAVDFVDQRVGGVRQSVVLVDLSLAREVGSVTLGLTVADIGEKPIAGGDTAPGRVHFGVGGYGRQLGPLDLGFAARVGVDDEDLVYGGGLEIGYWPVQGRTFVARVGFQDVPDGSEALPLTTGFAFQGDDITLEWAFRPFGEGAEDGGSHRLALRWR